MSVEWVMAGQDERWIILILWVWGAAWPIGVRITLGRSWGWGLGVGRDRFSHLVTTGALLIGRDRV